MEGHAAVARRTLDSNGKGRGKGCLASKGQVAKRINSNSTASGR